MTQLARRLVFGLRSELEDAGIAAQVNAIGSLATIFFTAGPVRNYTDAKRSDTKRYARFFPRNAGSRHLPGAVAIRGYFYLRGSHFRGYRPRAGRSTRIVASHFS